MSKRSGKSLNEIICSWIDISKELSFATTKLNYGVRTWFVCPDCNSRVGKLYVLDSRLSCGLCLNLYYLDRQSHRNKLFETVIRPAKQLKKLENKLKRKLRYETKAKLLEEYKRTVLRISLI